MLSYKKVIFIITALPVILLLGFSGCTPGGDEQSYEIDEYFDLLGLINDEIHYYQANPPESLRKTVQIDSKSETQQEHSDSLVDLKAIIETANINKPGLRGVYSTDTTVKVQQTDTLYSTIVHSLKPDEDALVELIKVYYNGSISKAHLSKILILKNRSNLLYHNAQSILIDFDSGHLSSLSLEGRQQILFFAPHSFKTDFDIIQ